MKRLVVLLVLILGTLTATAQEVCNNGRDDDGDGFIDCYDNNCSVSTFCKDFFLGPDAQCEALPPAFPQFTMALDFASPNETTNHLSRMAVGDLNRDGVPEIITMNKYTDRVFILNGDDGTIQQQATVSFDPGWEIAIANINNDACGEIFFFGYEDPPGPNNNGNYLYAYDCNLTLLWRSSNRLLGDPINYGLADFDGDGKVELYAKDEVYDAHTGIRIIRTSAADIDRWREINGGPVAVDMEGDDKLELVIGLAIYTVNLGTRALDVGSLTLSKKRSEYFARNEYNATSIADYNLDGFLDVLASGSTNSHGANTTLFFWDVQNNTLTTYSDPIPGDFTIFACPTATGPYYQNGWRNGTGRLNIADLDGDGKLNISYVSGKFLYALKEDLTPMPWSPKVVNEETSGYTGCTLFDFNGDGKSEIVYRDERFLYIINGTDGSIYNQQACVSRTNREYPIVADVDADGSTELCVTCGFDDAASVANFCNITYSRYSHVRVFRSGADPWVPARRVWNQHGYFNVNVNDDLTIPIKQQKHHLIFSTGSCTQGPNRPLNGFLNQSPFLNIDGCPTYKSPDLAFVNNSLTVTPPVCPNLNFTVSFQVQNIGDISLTGDVPISFYRGNPSLAGAVKLNTILVPMNNLSVSGTQPVTNLSITGPGGSFTMYIVLNDDGTTIPTPISLPNTNFLECDYANNIISVAVNPTPVAITALKLQDNIKCVGSTSPNNGAVRAFVPIAGGGENTVDYNFYWSIGAVAKPIPGDFQGAVLNGIPEGTYTVMARHKTAGCNSSTANVVVNRIDNSVTVNIIPVSPFTNCQNPNGSLRAVVNDTDGDGVGAPNALFDFVWYEGIDIFTDPQVGINATVSGLKALTYTVVVTEKSTGCQTIASATVPDQSVKPVVSTSVVNILCSSANSGSVSANVGGTTAGFRFDWYRGNLVLPSPDFTTPTVSNLPAGNYTLVVTTISTSCASDPITLTINQSTPVTVSVSGVSNQTSCDPALPNGTASANVAGNPPGISFEWFRGPNTLPANLFSNTQNVTGLVPGIYTVKATATASGCNDTEQVSINNSVVTPSLVVAAVGDMTNCVTPNGSITVNVSLDAPSDYIFSWYIGSAVKPTPDFTDTDNTLSGLPVRTYTVRAVHNTKNCTTAPISADIVDNTPTILISLNSAITVLPSDCSSANGVMEVTVSAPGNTGGFNIQWFFGRAPFAGPAIKTDNGVTISTATGLITGIYTVLATNIDNGCLASEEFALPFANAHGLTYVTQQNVDQCDQLDTGSITVDLDPTPLAGFDEDDYDINLYTGISDTGVPIQVIPGVVGTQIYTTRLDLTPGFYNLVAVSKNPLTLGCKSIPLLVEILHNVTFPAIVPAQINPNVNCTGAAANGSIQLNIDGAAPETNYSYVWHIGPNTSSPVLAGATTEIVQNLPASVYTVEVTNNATSCPSIASYQISDNPPVISLPGADMNITHVTLCTNLTGGAVTVNAVRENGNAVGVGSYTFGWFDANQSVLPDAITPNTTNSINNLAAGTYFVSVTKNAGASGLNCGSGLVPVVIEDQTIGTINVSLIDFTKPTRCLQPSNITGELVSNASGTSTTGYSYSWHAGNSATGPVISTNATLSGITIPLGQPDITFTVVAVNNSNQCPDQKTFVLPLDIVPVTLTASASPLTFCNVDDGSVFGTVTSGSSNNYNYLWYTGNVVKATSDFTGKQVNNLTIGNYTLVAVDQADNFCVSAPSTVTIDDGRVFPVVFASQIAPVTICDPARPDGVARATVGGDIINYLFDWYIGTPPSGASVYTGSEFGNLTAATYSVVATHLVTGCSDTTAVTINQNILPVPVPTVEVLSNVTSCRVDNGSLGASVNGNTGNFIFHWYNADPGTPPDTTSADFIGEIYSDLSAGRYYVSATSRITGCISGPANGEIIEEKVLPDFDFRIQPASCEQANGHLAIYMLNDVEIESVVWEINGGAATVTGPNLEQIPAGLYAVTVTSSLGCPFRKEVEVKTEIHPYNGVSRNGDGKNDFFMVNCIENFPENLVKIFNRAGTLVYEAVGYDNVETYFDGKSNKGINLMGDSLPDGTYFYVIDKRDGSKLMAGYLEVVK